MTKREQRLRTTLRRIGYARLRTHAAGHGDYVVVEAHKVDRLRQIARDALKESRR